MLPTYLACFFNIYLENTQQRTNLFHQIHFFLLKKKHTPNNEYSFTNSLKLVLTSLSNIKCPAQLQSARNIFFFPLYINVRRTNFPSFSFCHLSQSATQFVLFQSSCLSLGRYTFLKRERKEDRRIKTTKRT